MAKIKDASDIGDFLLADSEAGAPRDEHVVTAEAVLALAQAGKLRDSNDLKDFSAEMMAGLLRKQVTVGVSREMRQWAELIYSLIQTESLKDTGSEVNFIGQLIQMSGVTVEEGQKQLEKSAAPQIIDAEVTPIDTLDLDDPDDIFDDLFTSKAV